MDILRRWYPLWHLALREDLRLWAWVAASCLPEAKPPYQVQLQLISAPGFRSAVAGNPIVAISHIFRNSICEFF